MSDDRFFWGVGRGGLCASGDWTKPSGRCPLRFDSLHARSDTRVPYSYRPGLKTRQHPQNQCSVTVTFGLLASVCVCVGVH